MSNLFGDRSTIDKPTEINLYCDEVQPIKCPYTKENWFYIGIIVENLSSPLLPDIINERFCGNSDTNDPHYHKNDKVVHWKEINSADVQNICKRWFKYILDPSKSSKKFYAYILGINDTKLNKEEFAPNEQFNSKYNRFFRSAILYAIKTFFPNKEIIVKNIFHEEGIQRNHYYFPWHCISKIEKEENNITFENRKISFLSKDHKKDPHANLIQLCDVFLGATKSIIHGLGASKRSHYREDLIEIIFPLIQRVIKNPNNKNSSYQYSKRIMIRFFPKDKTSLDDIKRLTDQFYNNRPFYFREYKDGVQKLPF